MDQNAYDGDIVIEGVRHVYKGNTVALDGIDLKIVWETVKKNLPELISIIKKILDVH